MQGNMLAVLESYTKKNRQRSVWSRVVRIMACFVVFCTTYALILPAITQESEIYCGIAEHIHTDECYTQTTESYRQLDCTVTGDIAHTHNQDCLDENGTIVCPLPEREQHIHGDTCYAVPEQHFHDDSCYAWEKTLNCGREEGSSTEPVLVCTDPLTQIHVHSDECFTAAASTDVESTEPPQLICGQEEHKHTLSCHSDPTADLETPETWEQSISIAELTGIWNEDVVAIARTQRGYVESTRNYTVLEDETVRGYTRYGQWYGNPYGDWCAMFASFCLDYAGVEGMPLESSVPRWIAALSASKLALFQPQGTYVPDPGELIFFDWDQDGQPDHVGLVAELIAGEDGTVPKITTIEGNSNNRVQELSYSLDDERIFGYGELPRQLTAQEQETVNLVIAKIDALPSADEIDASLAAYAEAGDITGENAYYAEVSQQTAEAYYYYSRLDDDLKKAVTNAGKLLELEFIWSVTEYTETNPIKSDPVKVVQSAHISDLVELNMFDYYGRYSAAAAGKTDINDRFDNVSQEFPGFRWSAGAYPYKYYTVEDGWLADRHLPQSTDFGNSLITDYRITDALYEPDQAVAWGDGYRGEQSAGAGPITGENGAAGAINKVVAGADAGNGNLPIGVSKGTKVVSDRLGSDGYPSLIYSNEDIEDYDPSLSYLFDENHAGRFAARKNTESIDGLFQRDPISGEYFYNSRWNHAQYNEATSTFTLYDQVITPNFILYPFGNFLPFNDITDGHSAAQVQAFNYRGGVKDYILATLNNLEDLNKANQSADLSVIQLIRMLESYQASWEANEDPQSDNHKKWDEITAADALNDFFNGAAAPSTAKMDWARQPELAALLEELYNINYDVEKNFFFGMEMKMNFMQPKNGLTGNDNGNNETGTWEKSRDKNGDTLTKADDTMILTGEKDGIPDYPMVFSFTGDDDVWVYIDGIRFLDLSGIHNAVGGEIDFEKGMVYYYQPDPVADGDVRDDAYAEQSFQEILTRYGGIAEADLGKYLKQDENGNFTTFHDYSTHTFNFYYMERGAGSSVCDLNFNFPLLRKNSITVSKENTTLEGTVLDNTVLGNPDYYFNIVNSDNELFVGPGSVTGITQYRIQDSNGNIKKNDDGTDKIFVTDSYGIFTLKAGQSAIFDGIGENLGDFFVQELIKAEDNGQYHSVCVNDQKTRDNSLVDWSYRKYFYPEARTAAVYAGPYGCQWYAQSGEITDSGSGSAFFFKHQGRVDTSKLCKLSIRQELIGTDTGQTFDMAVTLDGVKLPVGTVYTVDGQDRTVTEAGIVTIGNGETATIGNILSGTGFEIRKAEIDAYTVGYSYTGNCSIDSTQFTQNDSVIGVVRTSSDVTVTVTNAENGASLQIPVNVSLAYNDGNEHTYTFVLEQVTDGTGASLTENGTMLEQMLVVAEDTASFFFNLPYLMARTDTLPATFYYRIAEKGEEADCLDNTQQFVAEVQVEADGDGIKATLVGINGSSNVKSADFINILAGSLKLTNTVNGDAEHKAKTFDFELELISPENVELPSEIQAVRTAEDDTQTMLTLQPENGRIRIEDLADGDTVAITGIPAGTQWTISQSYVDGFIVTTRVDDVTEEGRTAAGTVVTGDTAVDYTNTQTYVLPKTGGTGTSQYTMAGWMLLLCSAAYLLYKYTQRRRGSFTKP